MITQTRWELSEQLEVAHQTMANMDKEVRMLRTQLKTIAKRRKLDDFLTLEERDWLWKLQRAVDKWVASKREANNFRASDDVEVSLFNIAVDVDKGLFKSNYEPAKENW